jgi:hypothetical protein
MFAHDPYDFGTRIDIDVSFRVQALLRKIYDLEIDRLVLCDDILDHN